MVRTILAILILALAGSTSANTPTGTDVQVDFGDSVTVIFDSVVVAGQTALTTTGSDGPPVPEGFNLAHFQNPFIYQPATSAVYTGNIEVCIRYDENYVSEDESDLELLYFKNGAWIRIKDSVDTEENRVCGKAESLSSFVIGTYAHYCGDANGDETVNVSDAVWIINYVFIGGEPPDPLLTGDVDCSGVVNVSDAVGIINFVFIGGDPACRDCLGQLERIIITDRTGFEWDVTHAWYQYDLDTANYNFGLGPYAFTPIIEPEFLEPGDTGYPEPDETFTVIGASIEGEDRAYRRTDLTGVETANDIFPIGPILVAY